MSPDELPEYMSKRIVVNEPGCWIWTGALRRGYGMLSIKAPDRCAHRVAYRLLVGELAPGLHIDHLCRTPACVNPAHMEPVTSAVNVLRGVGFGAVNAAKTHCIHGHPFSGDNLLYSHSRGRLIRQCRACRRVIRQRYIARHPEHRAIKAEQERQRRARKAA